MANTIPYPHHSISELAKSLRKSIHSAHGAEIGQSEMLQILAKAAGFQNYQSLKATDPSISKDELLHRITVSTELHGVGEVFERGPDGLVLDRRHQQVKTVLASVTFTVTTVISKASFNATVRIPIDKLRERELDKPEKYLARYALKHIVQNKDSFLKSLNMMSNVEIVISDTVLKSYINVPETTTGMLFTDIAVNNAIFLHLVEQSNKVTNATNAYNDSISYLKDLAFSESSYLSSEQRELALRSLQHMERSMAISTEKGRVTMYSWNREKFPEIKTFITKLAHGQKFSDSEQEYARRNLYSWSAGDVWLNEA
ncbi:hypothetical protein ACROAD_17045 [Shewanella baltica]|uniref:hypothetical protein n=1 Tax=Shewanella baltica TaxID=62322 RepID=UPI003D7B33A8